MDKKRLKSNFAKYTTGALAQLFMASALSISASSVFAETVNLRSIPDITKACPQLANVQLKTVTVNKLPFPTISKITVAGEIKYPHKQSPQERKIYQQRLSAFRRLRKNWPATLEINSRGGSVFEIQKIISAAHHSQGKIITVVNGEASSAASVILVSGKIRYVSANARVFFHKARRGSGGRKKFEEDFPAGSSARTGLSNSNIWMLNAYVGNSKTHITPKCVNTALSGNHDIKISSRDLLLLGLADVIKVGGNRVTIRSNQSLGALGLSLKR